MSELNEISLTQHYQEQHQKLLTNLEPDWLKFYRIKAFEAFMAQGIPTTAIEAWKYTHLRAWHKNKFHKHPTHEEQVELYQLQLFSMLDEDCQEVIVIDGDFQPIAKQNTALQIMDYKTALKQHEALLQNYMGQAIQHENHPFASLCDALAQNGVVIFVPENTIIEKPIHVLYVSSKNCANCANHLRNLIVVGKNSSATVIEHYVDLDDVVYFTNSVTEIILEHNASLSHYKIEQEGNKSFHIGSIHSKQNQGSHLCSYAVTLCGNFSRHDFNAHLVGENAQCTMNGLYFTHNQQHVDYHTLVNHDVPQCTSRSLYKGILADKSTTVFNGKVVVKQGAQKTQAMQGNHNLLLTSQCEANSKPELEIYTDDVKCTHGATTGQLDEEALFFLQARGIALSKARRMLIRAFANDIFNQMSANIVREYCQRYLEMAAYE
ncbi:MAG: Fe-S cluster assembly protein SufD [Gammaproteobacteria bacterium]|jgi:Fe-S cluster assembly protein SufD